METLPPTHLLHTHPMESVAIEILRLIHSSGRSRIFMKGTNSQSGIILQTFCSKLYENEIIWTPSRVYIGTRPLTHKHVKMSKQVDYGNHSSTQTCPDCSEPKFFFASLPSAQLFPNEISFKIIGYFRLYN